MKLAGTVCIPFYSLSLVNKNRSDMLEQNELINPSSVA